MKLSLECPLSPGHTFLRSQDGRMLRDISFILDSEGGVVCRLGLRKSRGGRAVV